MLAHNWVYLCRTDPFKIKHDWGALITKRLELCLFFFFIITDYIKWTDTTAWLIHTDNICSNNISNITKTWLKMSEIPFPYHKRAGNLFWISSAKKPWTDGFQLHAVIMFSFYHSSMYIVSLNRKTEEIAKSGSFKAGIFQKLCSVTSNVSFWDGGKGIVN